MANFVFKATAGVYKNTKTDANRLDFGSRFVPGSPLIFDSDADEVAYLEGPQAWRHRKTGREPFGGAAGSMASSFFPSLNKFRTFLREKKGLMLEETLVLGEAGDENFPVEEGKRFFQLALEMDGNNESKKIDLPVDGQNVTVLKSSILEAAVGKKINRMVLHYINDGNDTEIEAVNLIIPDEEETLQLVQGLLADFLQQKKELLKTVNNVLGNLNDRHFPEEGNYARWLLKNFNISLDTE